MWRGLGLAWFVVQDGQDCCTARERRWLESASTGDTPRKQACRPTATIWTVPLRHPLKRTSSDDCFSCTGQGRSAMMEAQLTHMACQTVPALKRYDMLLEPMCIATKAAASAALSSFYCTKIVQHQECLRIASVWYIQLAAL